MTLPTISNAPVHDRAELNELTAALREIGPGWLMGEGAEGLLRAERLGTKTYTQAAMSPRALLEAVEDAERRIDPHAVVPVRRGLGVMDESVKLGGAATQTASRNPLTG